jgi:hypothetical protein
VLGKIESVNGFDLSNLDCVFEVKKSLKPEPNTCKIKLYGLSRETRRVLTAPKKLVVRLEAGYPDLIEQLFLGEVRSAVTTREGPDLVTEITTGDSSKEIATQHINLSIGPSVPVSEALQQICKSLKVGMGNVPKIAAQLAKSGKAFFGPGTALSGYSSQILTDFCRSADLEWSIQDGVLQILARGTVAHPLAVELSSSTGLIGSPSVDHKGLVKATCLIQPGLRPGAKVNFASADFKGGYRIEKTEYSGDTAGTSWYAKLECKKY